MNNIYIVANSNDSGDGSLRYGIENSGLDTIIFSEDILYKNIDLSAFILVDRSINIINNSNQEIFISCATDSIFVLSNKTKIMFQIFGNLGINLVNSNSKIVGGAINNSFNTNSLVFNNITIKNCTANYGGAIFTLGFITLNECVISENTAEFLGGGIFSTSSITINDCVINKNIIISETEFIGGAGLFIYADTNLKNLEFNIKNTIIKNNFVEYNPIENTGASGAGVYVFIYDYTIIFDNCIIEENYSKNGSGIYVNNGNLSCIGCSIRNNIASNYQEGQDPVVKPVLTGGGCGITSMSGNINVSRCIISDNKSYGMYSSGIVGFNGNLNCSNSSIQNNVNVGPGGGIAVNLNCNINIDKTIINNNSASGLGGALINFSTNQFYTNIKNSFIQNNQLDNRENTKSVYINIFQTAIYTFKNIINFINNFNIIDKQNTKGIIKTFTDLILLYTDIYIKRLNYVNYYTNFIGGGAICMFDDCNLYLDNCLISDNYLVKDIKASYGVSDYIAAGGAIITYNSALININECSIQENKCNGIAGAIFNNGSILNISKTQIIDNKLISVIYSKNADQTLVQNGGGIFISPGVGQSADSYAKGSGTYILGTDIHGNTCIIGCNGGGIYNAGGDMILSYSNVSNNSVGGVYITDELSNFVIPIIKISNTRIADNTEYDIKYNYTYIENIDYPK